MIRHRKKNKKGITPIIAIVLLLMMTVATAGAAFFWFIRIQGELQGGTESYTGELSEKMSAKVDVLVTYYDGNVNIYLQNNGNIEVPISKSGTNPTTTWILQDPNQNVVCSSYWGDATKTECVSGCTGTGTTLEIGEIQKVELDIDGDCNIASNATYTAGSKFYFIIDFSGEVATGGEFVK